MLIANPIYDSVFKYLMEDPEIAKKLLSTITGEEIVEIELKPQEQSVFSKTYLIQILRLDFNATIKTKDGALKKILIELQKGKQLIDIMRFRRYLGENYQREEELTNAQGIMEKQILPIITIYILGFELPNVRTSVLKVNRVYTDVITQEQLFVKEDFIEKLTHDSYVIQIPRLQQKMQNRIEKILAVFNQAYVTKDKKILNVPNEVANDEVSERMAKRLAKATESEEIRKELEAEETFEYAFENFLRGKDAIIEQKEGVIMEKEGVIMEKEGVIMEKEGVIMEKEGLLMEKEQVINEKEQTIEELLKEIERLKNQ